MEATFRVTAAEFNTAFIDKVKDFLSLVEDGYVTVSIRDEEPIYSEKILRSKAELERGENLISFTMEELEAYATSKQP